MSYSSNPVLDAERHIAATTLSDLQADMWGSFYNDFLAQMHKPMEQPCLLSAEQERFTGCELVRRRATVAEFLADALTAGYSADKLTAEDATALLVRAAKGEDIKAEALEMFKRAAKRFADDELEKAE